MAFIWNSESNIPPANLPVPVADGELSFEQKEVANTVIVHPIYGVGTLSQNVSSDDFDIIYSLPTFNVKDLHVTHLESNTVTVLFHATINTANIGAATINTANIVNATIANGRMGVNPTSNLQIATKEYVDSLAANSVPLGGNLQLLIQAAGDLLVGVSDNTAERLPVGTNNGGVLLAGASGNTGLRWTVRSPGATATHRNLFIGTNYDEYFRNNQVQLVSVSEIIMDDGIRVSSGWNGLTASILSNVATSGVGYLDTGVAQANTCYEVWAIRSSSNGAQGLILHRSMDRLHNASADGSIGHAVARKIKYTHGSGQMNCVNAAQNFVATKSGPLVRLDMSVIRSISSPVGNCWITLESDSAGNASGVPLATSRLLNVARLPTESSPGPRIPFIFETKANVVSGNTYWAVIHADYLQGDAQLNDRSISLLGTASGTISYTGGVAKDFSANSDSWQLANNASAPHLPPGPGTFYFRTIIEANNTDVLMPTGYDQKCLVSYVFTDFLTRTREYKQRGHRMVMAYSYSWAFVYTGGTGVLIAGSGADQAEGTGTAGALESVTLNAYVPPVPCLMWVYHYGLTSQTLTGFGKLDATDMVPIPPVVLEADGQICANLCATGDGTQITGPIPVEFQTILSRISTSSGGLYVAGIEF